MCIRDRFNRAGSSASPFSNISRDFTTSNSDNVVSGKTVVVDYSYYQGRVDRLYLTRDGIFDVKEGKPSRVPKAPLHNENAFQVATIKYPPYVRHASEVLTKTVPHKSCLLYTSPSPRDVEESRMPSSA